MGGVGCLLCVWWGGGAAVCVGLGGYGGEESSGGCWLRRGAAGEGREKGDVGFFGDGDADGTGRGIKWVWWSFLF